MPPNPTPDPMSAADPMLDPQMPAGQGPEGGGDMVAINRSAFEDLKEILSGIISGIDEILAAQQSPAGGEGMEMEEEAEEEEMSSPAPGAPAMEDEEFLKSLMAEGNNRTR